MNTNNLREAVLSCAPNSNAQWQNYYHRMLTLIDRCSEEAAPCWHRNRSTSHFTASSFIINPQGSFLAIFHTTLQRWLQPGGHIEDHDTTPFQSALREALEEVGHIGLEPLSKNPIDLDIHSIPHKGNRCAHEHFDIRYAWVATEYDRVQINHESQAWQWLSNEQLASWAQDSSISRAIIQTQSLWLQKS